MSVAPVHWTLLFAGACALLQCVLTALVIVRRVRSKIDFLEGDDPTLLRRVRAHGNFSETAPMALLLMLLLELSGVASVWLVMLGTALLLGRLLHAAGVLGWGGHRARILGMALTLAALSLGGLGCLGIALASMPAAAWASTGAESRHRPIDSECDMTFLGPLPFIEPDGSPIAVIGWEEAQGAWG